MTLMLLDAFIRNPNCCSLIPSCSNHCHELNIPVRPEFVGYRACHTPQICSAIDKYMPCLVNENASNHYAARSSNLRLQTTVPTNDGIVHCIPHRAFIMYQNFFLLSPVAQIIVIENTCLVLQFDSVQSLSCSTNLWWSTDTYRPWLVKENASKDSAARVATYSYRRARAKIDVLSKSFVLFKINAWYVHVVALQKF